MQNPIIQMLSGNKQNPQNNILQRISSIKSMLNNGNIDNLYSDMMRNNPQFRDFVAKSEGKTIEDIALEYDLNLDFIKQIFEK